MKQLSIFLFLLLTCVASAFAQTKTKETPKVKIVRFTPPMIVNDQGYEIHLQPAGTDTLVKVRNTKMTKTISMKEWRKQPDVYEKKYGKLPSAEKSKM